MEATCSLSKRQFPRFGTGGFAICLSECRLGMGPSPCLGGRQVEEQSAIWANGILEALSMYRKAAEQGHASAQNTLGWMHAKGDGVVQSYVEAVRWYKKAAKQGDANAQLNLGSMYENGDGVAQSHAEALRWYRKAAEQGDAGAQFFLGLMYGQGKGVAKNTILAHMWMNLAASQGIPSAIKFREIAASQMTKQQIAEAQLRATQCQAKNYKSLS